MKGCTTSLVPSPSYSSFYLAAVEKKLGCEIKAEMGRTGNEANARQWKLNECG